MTAKTVSLSHGDDVARRKHGHLIAGLKLYEKYRPGHLPQEYTTNACWEVDTSAGADFSDV